MEPIETYEPIGGYSQPTMTSPPVSSPNNYDKFGAAGRVLYELAEENEKLREVIGQHEKDKNDVEKYKRRYQEKSEECDDLKEENKALKEKNKLLESQKGIDISQLKFLYNYDIMDFSEKLEASDIERIIDICLELAKTPMSKGYLIDDSMDIIPIYILLAEKGVFKKHGNSEKDTRNWGLTAFCNIWNNNVLPRIDDEARRDKLRCDSSKISNELKKELWKAAASCSWSNLYKNCDNSNGRASRKKAKLGRAINIQKRLESLLEQIPILKSKKF